MAEGHPQQVTGVTSIGGTPSDGREDFRLLDNDAFRAWWFSRLVAQTAQSALLYGLLILIVDQTDRSIYASLFVICSIVPSLLFGLIGGWAADRLPQRALLTTLNILRALVVIPLIREPESLVVLFAVTLGIWTVHQFYSPAETAVMARILPESRLADGTSMGNLALTLAQVAGMVILAPLLLRLPDARPFVAICAAGYAVAAIFMLDVGRLRPRERASRTIPFNLRRGWEIATSSGRAFNAFADVVLIAIGLSALLAIVPSYLEHVLNTGADNTVFVFAPAVIGLVIGLRIAPPLGRWLGHGRIAIVATICFAFSAAAFGAIDSVADLIDTAGVPLASLADQLGLPARTLATMLISIPAGFFSAIVNVAARAVLLEIAPEDSRGQVFATQGVIGNAGALIPTLLAGIAVDLIGSRTVAIVLALSLLAGTFGAMRYARGLQGKAQDVSASATTSA